ncbi:hypothetical protein QE152_g40172 [Popillia japonica]|uniref:Uncharacterized protein n=1 Tax=Popillia japonica TaxID=7064 RepID=A0AAW1HS50_POPJA
MKKHHDKFDTSNFPEDNIYKIPRSLPRLGKMKDEYGGKIIESFFGTGAKAYCVKLLDRECKTAKGVKKYVINKHLTVNDYKGVLETGGTIFCKTAKGVKKYVINKHLTVNDYKGVLETGELVNKVALTCKDEKRSILEDKRQKTLAWGHYKIDEIVRQRNLDELVDFGLGPL